jgi:hypothetical protein
MGRSTLGILVALLFATTWMTPSGAILAPRTAVAALAPRAVTQVTTPPQLTFQRGAPGYRVMPTGQIARLARLSAHRSKTAPPFFRGGVRRKAQPSSPTASAIATLRATATAAFPRVAVYNGLNKPGMNAVTNQDTPPDSTGAIGPNNYVEMVNSEIEVWRRADLSAVSTVTLDTFIGDTSGNPYCDGQVQWDPSSNRWLFSFLFCDPTQTTQYIVFGWSKTSDPTNLTADNSIPASGWCAFGLLTPGLLDFDKLGHNSKYIIVGGNLYATPSFNPSFLTAAIYWLPKPAAGNTSCTLPATLGQTSTSTQLKNGDNTTPAFTPVPVNTMTGATDGYVVSAYDPSGSNGRTPAAKTKLAIWHLDSTGMLHQNADITVPSFDVPTSAPQNGSSNLIDTLDARLTHAVGDPTTGIWFQHTVAGSSGRSVVRWYEIQVVGSVASKTQQGDIASATDWVFNGSISPRFDGLGAAIFYNRSSTAILPVIAAQDRRAATALGAMDPGEVVLATSTATDSENLSCGVGGFPCRWGDYSAASPDPVQVGLVWGTNEFTPMASVLMNPSWGDENFAITVPGRDAAIQSSPAPTPSRDPANQSSPIPTPGAR